MSTIDLYTEHYRLRLMTPAMVTSRWVEWSSDSAIMRQLNAKTKKLSKADIQNYVAASTAKKLAIVGIFRRSDGDHVGIYEVLFDQTHRNANLDILIDINRYGLSDVLTETNPVLLAHLQQRFGADKAAIVIPKTYVAMIRYMAEAGWKQEGILRVEYPPARGGQRIDGLQFGKILKI